jgi:hypothetical protein
MSRIEGKTLNQYTGQAGTKRMQKKQPKQMQQKQQRQ